MLLQTDRILHRQNQRAKRFLATYFLTILLSTVVAEHATEINQTWIPPNPIVNRPLLCYLILK
jgi:hypothetical protein